MGDHSHHVGGLDWTLGRVEIRRFEMDGQRCVLLAAPDPDMWEYGGEIQAVVPQELDELINALQDERAWMTGVPTNDELRCLRMRVDEEMARRDDLGSGLGHAKDALDAAAAALEAIARGADPALADSAAQAARDAAGVAFEYIPDWEG